MDSRKVVSLLEKHKLGTLTKEEASFLESWYVHHAKQAHYDLSAEELQQHVRRLRNTLPILTLQKKRKVIWWKFAAAAAFIGLLSVGLLYFKEYSASKEDLLFGSANPILPANGEVVLTRADGKQIALLADKEGLRIQAGKLLYQDGSKLPEESPNTATSHKDWYNLRTAIGGQYQLILEDGTKVWLNASTSLRYPAVFHSQAREVELQGEAYFEVAKDAQRPFIVHTVQQRIEVLGTQFNVSSYANDRVEETSLFEGAVRVAATANTQQLVLKPGQQAVVQGKTMQLEKVDPALVLDWKQGQFQFDETSLESIMHKLARWYAIEVRYLSEDLKAEPFYGLVSRKSSLQEVLQILTLAGDASFELRERTVTVRKK